MACIKEGAIVKGKVSLQEEVSIWYNVVIRSEVEEILIDEQTNIQDGCILHTDPSFPMHIGKKVTVGHGAILHGCTIEDEVLIGMGAIVMNGAHIGKHSIIGAGAVVPEGKEIPENSLVVGCPAKVIKQVSEAQVQMILDNAQEYVDLSKESL